MKQQFVVIHTDRRTEIPVLLDSWVTNAQIFYPQKIASCHIFITALHA
jgi:hypothetical protein